MPPRGDSEQQVEDRLARLEDALAECAAELAEIRREREAKRRKRRRSDTVLWVVKAAAFVAAGLGVLIAFMAPVRMHQQQYRPRCVIQCSRPVAHPVPDGRATGR